MPLPKQHESSLNLLASISRNSSTTSSTSDDSLLSNDESYIQVGSDSTRCNGDRPQPPPRRPSSNPPVPHPVPQKPEPPPSLPVLPTRSRGRRHPLLKRRNLMLISTISVVFSILSFTALLFLFMKQVAPSWEDNTFAEGTYETCVPCIYLKSSAEDDASTVPELKMLKSKNINDQTHCCARTSGQMSALIMLIAKQQSLQRNIAVTEQASTYQSNPSKEFRFSPVSAHKFLAPFNPGKLLTFNGGHETLIMKTGTDILDREHVRNVGLRKNSISIEHSGWYFVYSSVLFRPKFQKSCKHLKHQSWGQFVMRLRPGRPAHSGTLAKTVHTCCDECSDDHHSSYVGGVFRLEKGDSIYVEVTTTGLVRFEGSGTFLGLVMLGSGDEGNSSEMQEKK